MLDEKMIKEIENRVRQFMREGVIETKQPREHVSFFLNNAKNSLETARAIYGLSTNEDYQNYTGNKGLNGFLWVVNAGYYSMFYTARALLESEGIRLKSSLSVHSLTFDALVYFFYLNNKLQKRMLEVFAEAQEEAEGILGKEKTDALMKEYLWEKKKRAALTYETGEEVIQNKAQTSLQRAKNFSEEIRIIIQRPL